MSNINNNHRENPKSRGNTLNKKNGKQWKTILNKDIARRPGNGTNEMNSTKFDRLHPWTLGWKPMTGTPIMIPRHNKNITPFVVGIYFLPIMVPSNRTVQRANRRKLFHHFPSLNSGRRSRLSTQTFGRCANANGIVVEVARVVAMFSRHSQ